MGAVWCWAVAGLALAIALPYLATHLRGVFVTIFLLPVNAVYVLYLKIRNWIRWNVLQNPGKHADRVRAAQKQVQNANGMKMCTARPGWLTMSQRFSRFKKHCAKIDLSGMCDILSLDRKRQVVVAEPLVTVAQLSAYLQRAGFALAVLPELDELTVGGLLMGFGIETSSHIYGLFQDIMVAAEVLLADGRVVNATRDGEFADLFFALPWSHGTLGFVTSVTLKIIPAKEYVHLRYFPCHSRTAVVELLAKYSTMPRGEAPQFVEALLYDGQNAVVMIGDMAEASEVEPSKLNTLSRWYKPWFYKHVETILDSSRRNVAVSCAVRAGSRRREPLPFRREYVPLRDYYHRHTRSLFWEMAEAVPFGNAPWYRLIFGLFPPAKVSMLKATQTKAIEKILHENLVLQDMLVPLSELEQAIGFFDANYEIYPVWLCPHRLYATPHQGLLCPADDTIRNAAPAPGSKQEPCGMVANCDTDLPYEMFVDVGVYGRPKKPYNQWVDMPKMEKRVAEMKGYQALYARIYMNRAQFRAMFSHDLHDLMRVKYGAERCFPEIYEKVSDSLLPTTIAEEASYRSAATRTGVVDGRVKRE